MIRSGPAVTLLPTSATPFERAIATGDDRMLGIDADLVRRVTSPDDCPADQLHVLAWEYSVDEWDPLWSGGRKRQVIKASVEVHRFKGTAYGVSLAIEAVGQNVLVEEWFEYGGHAYCFRLVVDLDELEVFSRAQIEQLIRVALRTKNARSLLDLILFRRTSRGVGHLGGYIRAKVSQTLGPELPSLITVRPYVYAGIGMTARTITTVYPGA